MNNVCGICCLLFVIKLEWKWCENLLKIRKIEVLLTLKSPYYDCMSQ